MKRPFRIKTIKRARKWMKHQYDVIAVLAVSCVAILSSCSGDINSNFDSHFTNDGYLIQDSTKQDNKVPLTKAKFYVEVSGSMNGFFRAGQPTDFKKDV